MEMPQLAIRLPPKPQLAEFCRKHGIRKLAVFGSATRSDFRAAGDNPSDIDFLVEFEPGKMLGLIGLAAIERELSKLVGGKADIRSPADLSRYFRDDVIRSSVVLYAA